MKATELTENISKALGIQSLNPMQQQMLKSKSPRIILTAPTGSGKTLAFTIRMLRNLKAPCAKVQAVVIAPSRELVIQIASVVRPVARGYKTVALYGGHSMADETNSLSPLPDIIIATPGRLLDHLQRSNIEINSVNTLVLDEYDKSLELGFEGEMRKIVRRIGHVDNLILTSATTIDPLPDYLPLDNPEYINFTPQSSPKSRIQIVEVESPARDKLDTLIALLRSFKRGERSIVFVNHRESAERVYQRLIAEKLPATLYHGALDQHEREKAIDIFTNGSAPILVATDLAARGLDITDVANVIHYHLPVNEATWTHRNGRTARVDADGTVWIIRSDADNIAPYITPHRSYAPDPDLRPDLRPDMATIYISAGKKEKISKGDIAGFTAASAVTSPDEIGMIIVHDHHSLVAVPREKARPTAQALNAGRLKGKKIRASVVK